MPPRPRPPPGTPHGDITDDLPHRLRSNSPTPDMSTSDRELLNLFHADTEWTPDGLRGPINTSSGPSTGTLSMNHPPLSPYDGEAWSGGQGHGTPAAASQRGEISNLLHSNHGGTRMERSRGMQGSWLGLLGNVVQGQYHLPYHPGYNGESSSSTVPGRHAHHGIPTRGESSRSAAASESTTPEATAPITIPAHQGAFGILHPPQLMQPRPQHTAAPPLPTGGEFGLLVPRTFPALNESNLPAQVRSLASSDNYALPPISGVISSNGDWEGPNNTRSRIRMNGVAITLAPRGETVDGNTRILSPMPRWRAALEELDAHDQYVITHRPWRTMRGRFPRGWEVKTHGGGRGWRVEDRVGFVGTDGVAREMLLSVTRDPDHRIVSLDWHPATGDETAVNTAIWTNIHPALIVTAPPSYHSFGDVSDITDIAADHAAACTCCTRREAKLTFACGHRMCRSCVLGMWWGAITRPHHWPSSLKCAFCRAVVGRLEGLGVVEWVLEQSSRARAKLGRETVEEVRPEGMWALLWELKRCYEKKGGKATAAPGSNMDPLGRVTIHDRFFPANLH